MYVRTGLWAAGLGLAVAIAAGPAGAQTPKRGGTLTYVIPADAPPSFDGHRETTYATVHAAASLDAYNRGETDRALTLGQQAIAESSTLTPARYVATAWVSTVTVARGDPAAGTAVMADLRRLLADDRPEDFYRWGCHTMAAFILNLVGDHTGALTEARDLVAMARRLGVPTRLAGALSIYAHIVGNEDPLQALAALDEALTLYDEGSVGGEALYASALMDAAVLRAASGDIAGAARAARTALDFSAHTGNRPDATDAIAIAAVVLAACPDGLDVAATLDGAREGPTLGAIPPQTSGIHQYRIDAAREHAAAGLGPDAFAAARACGAAMSYDEIIAYALEQLGQIADDR